MRLRVSLSILAVYGGSVPVWYWEVLRNVLHSIHGLVALTPASVWASTSAVHRIIPLTRTFICAQDQRERPAWPPSLIRLRTLTWRSLWRTWTKLFLPTPDLYSFVSFRRSPRQVEFYFLLLFVRFWNTWFKFCLICSHSVRLWSAS